MGGRERCERSLTQRPRALAPACAPCHLLQYYLQACRGRLSTGFSAIDIWCVVHAGLDAAHFEQTATFSRLYFPVHVISHMSLALGLYQIAAARAAGKGRHRLVHAMQACVLIKFVAVLITTAREMALIEWVNPSFIGHDIPPIDDITGAVIYMVFAFLADPSYGTFVFGAHIISALTVGPCHSGQITCAKNTFNNATWHASTLLFGRELRAAAESAETARPAHHTKTE